MAITTSEIRAIARVVWDNVAQSENPSATDIAFLEATSRADKRLSQTLGDANILYGVKSDTYRAVKNLAIRQHEHEYRAAHMTLEAADEIEFAEAAE